MIAVVMAGGRATRLGGDREKALLEVGGHSLLSRAVGALRTEGIDDIVVALTKATPRTKALSESLGLSTLQTAARGYHEDTVELLDILGPYISLNVDVPFVRPRHIRKLLDSSGGHSLAAVVPSSIAVAMPDRESRGKDSSGTDVVWVGLNMVTRDKTTSYLVFDDPMLSVNINTDEDLALARRLVDHAEK